MVKARHSTLETEGERDERTPEPNEERGNSSERQTARFDEDFNAFRHVFQFVFEQN